MYIADGEAEEGDDESVLSDVSLISPFRFYLWLCKIADVNEGTLTAQPA